MTRAVSRTRMRKPRIAASKKRAVVQERRWRPVVWMASSIVVSREVTWRGNLGEDRHGTGFIRRGSNGERRKREIDGDGDKIFFWGYVRPNAPRIDISFPFIRLLVVLSIYVYYI